jgi:hypothetical protein
MSGFEKAHCPAFSGTARLARHTSGVANGIIMSMKFARVCLALCCAAALHTAVAETVAEHKARMDAAQDLKDEITDTLAAKAFTDVTRASGDLVKFSQAEENYWAALKRADALALARQATAAAKQLNAASMKSDAAGAAAAFDALNKTCTSCHDLHPEKK